MKRRLPLFLLVIVLVGGIYAQKQEKKERKNYRHEVSLSFSSGKKSEGFRQFDELMCQTYPITRKGTPLWELKGGGALHYYYRLNRRIALGGMGALFRESQTYDLYKISHTYSLVPYTINNIRVHNDEIPCKGQPTATSLVLIPTAKFIWTDARKVRLYAKLGLGVYLQKMNFNLSFPIEYHIESLEYKRMFRSHLAWQILPFGIELGCGHVCFFAEGGWGTTPFNFGLTYRFKQINKQRSN